MNRCERKKEVGSQLDSDMAGQKRIAYVWSVLLAIGNVIFKIFPYFIIADVVKLFLSGEKEFEPYLVKAVLIVLSFIIAELFHSLSTALSHKATFTVLANIRKSCCDKLARVPLGYVKDTPSGTFKNIMVERIDSIETTLAHIVPEFTSNLLAPVVILIYFFLTDWRLALWSLVPVIVGLFSYFGMMLDYKPSFERTVQTTKDLNDAAVEYIDGIEVIKAFGKTESSYAKFTKAAFEYADSFISWMKWCSIFHALMMVVTPYTLLTVLPFGAHYVANGTLAVSDFVICIILSLGIVGPLIGEVTLGGVNVKDYSMNSLMRNFSFVFQSVYLFADTIENNIKFGRQDASHEEVVEAAKKACCYDFISKLPDGYNTVIGEGGATLSGSEKQRISIARAIMKDASIVILDEATANVDPENEKELMDAVDALTKEKTIIMIAHRCLSGHMRLFVLA